MVRLVKGALSPLVLSCDLGQPFECAEAAVLLFVHLAAGPAVQILQAGVHIGGKVVQRLLVVQAVADIGRVVFDKVLRPAPAQDVQDARPPVGLSGVSGRILLHHRHIQAGVLLLGRYGCGHARQAAPHNQEIGLHHFCHHCGPPTYT